MFGKNIFYRQSATILDDGWKVAYGPSSWIWESRTKWLTKRNEDVLDCSNICVIWEFSSS